MVVITRYLALQIFSWRFLGNQEVGNNVKKIPKAIGPHLDEKAGQEKSERG